MNTRSLIEFSWLLLALTSAPPPTTADFTNEPFLDDSTLLADMNILRHIPRASESIARFFAKAPEMFKSWCFSVLVYHLYDFSSLVEN